MIIVMKPHAAENSIKAIADYIQNSGLHAHLSRGTEVTIIGVVGGASNFSTSRRVTEMANLKYQRRFWEKNRRRLTRG